MKPVLVVGVVRSSALGDFMQYYAAVELLRRHLPDPDLVLAVPGGSGPREMIPGTRVLDGLGEMASVRHFARTVIRRKSEGTEFSGTRLQKEKVSSTQSAIGLLSNQWSHSWRYSRYLQPAIARARSSERFAAAVVGGHTVGRTVLRTCMVDYFVSRTLTKGPVITFPISISKIGVKNVQPNILTKMLKCFDRVFVRGPYSLELLGKYVGKERAEIALDSGFALRGILGPLKRKSVGLRVAILPRLDYFTAYNEPALQDLYISSLAKVTRWLTRSRNAQVYLVPQTLPDEVLGYLGDMAAINRLLGHLGKEKMRVRVFNPRGTELESVAQRYRLFASTDLVLASRMHGGILAMSAGAPTLFCLPTEDTKLLDVMSFLGLSIEDFVIDMFDSRQLQFANFVRKIKKLLDDSSRFSNITTRRVDAALPQAELPAKIIARRLA